MWNKIEKLSNEEIINFILEKVKRLIIENLKEVKSIQGVKFSNLGVRILAQW